MVQVGEEYMGKVVMNTEHFNWLQKRIWKILLGIKIEDVEEDKR